MRTYLATGALIAPVFTSGCGLLGLYSGSQVDDITEQHRQRGLEEGYARAVRVAAHEEQNAAAQKQVEERYYVVPVPAHVNAQGVRIEDHFVPFRVVVEKEEM